MSVVSILILLMRKWASSTQGHTAWDLQSFWTPETVSLTTIPSSGQHLIKSSPLWWGEKDEYSKVGGGWGVGQSMELSEELCLVPWRWQPEDQPSANSTE